MYRIERLKREAAALARSHGHTLARWHDGLMHAHSQTFCITCGKWVEVNVATKTVRWNGYYLPARDLSQPGTIAGRATTEDCH